MNSSVQADPFPYVVEMNYRRRWTFLLAGLPHFLMGLVIFLERMDGDILTGLPTLLLVNISDALLVIFMAVSLGVGVYSVRRYNPLWAAAWSGYTFVTPVLVIGSILVIRNEANYIYRLGFLLLALLAVLIIYFLRFHRSRLHALLMSLILLPVGSMLILESISDPVFAWFALSMGLLAGLTSALMVAVEEWHIGVVLALSAFLLGGAALAYVNSFMSAAPTAADEAFLDSAGGFALYSLLAIMLYLGPWLFWSVRDYAMRKAT